MANIFYDRKISRVFDLKGSLRGRFAAQIQGASNSREEYSTTPAQTLPETPSSNTVDNTAAPTNRKRRTNWTDDALTGESVESGDEQRGRDTPASNDLPQEPGLRTLLDGDFLEFTQGRPMPMTDRAKAIFQMSILNVSATCSRARLLHHFAHCRVNINCRTLFSYQSSMSWTIPYWWAWMRRTWNLWLASSTLCVNTIF